MEYYDVNDRKIEIGDVFVVVNNILNDTATLISQIDIVQTIKDPKYLTLPYGLGIFTELGSVYNEKEIEVIDNIIKPWPKKRD